MAEVKISALTAATGLTDDDVLIVNDGATTKKITAANSKAGLTVPTHATIGSISNEMYFLSNGTHSMVSAALGFVGRVWYVPFRVSATASYDGLLINVNVAEATSTARLAIYDSTSAGLPDSLIVDAGTVDVSTTGEKEATFTAVELSPGALYWAAVTAQGSGAATLRGGRSYNASVPLSAVPTTNAGLQTVTNASAVTGAYPATADTVFSTVQSATPNICLRAV